MAGLRNPVVRVGEAQLGGNRLPVVDQHAVE
jgi:hypothetical protein